YIVRTDRDGAMTAVDQNGELDRGRATALPQRRHRALHGPSAVDHVVDQHDRAIFHFKMDFERTSAAVEWMERGLSAEDVERHARRTNVGLGFDQIAQAQREHRAVTYYADDRDRGEIRQVGGYLRGQRAAGRRDFVGVHDFALRTAAIRFVAALL